MDLYTLNENFLARDVIDEYVSAIWTERYTDAGDVRLIYPASIRQIDRLKPGTYLGLRGSQEVMEIKSQSIEDGLVTAVGKSLLTFLDERYVWFFILAADDKIADYSDATRVPGAFISEVVRRFAIAPTPFPSGYQTTLGMQWDLETIPNLSLGEIDASGTAKLLQAPIGPLLTAIQPVAEQNNVGIRLYVASADPVTGYSLKFDTYQGQDRTSGQTENPLLRLSPNMETLSGIKEVNSLDGYKNVVYVMYQGNLSVHYEDPDHIPEGMNRRVLVVNAEGAPIPNSKYTVTSPTGSGQTYVRTYVGPADVAAFREQTARNALANHNLIHAIDGQTSPENDFTFGVDYQLGDLIELQSFTGKISKARITEYIRSEDQQGEREYPTISVVP